jgi:hypothetical protein
VFYVVIRRVINRKKNSAPLSDAVSI